MKRLRFTSYSSSYHCPISKRLDCSGWLSDWPQALAGRAGHCEGRLGNELEIGDPTIQTDCWGQKRTNKQLGSEGRGGRGVERLWKHKGQTKRVSMLEKSKSKGSWCSLALMSNTAPLLLQYCDIWLWRRRFTLPRGEPLSEDAQSRNHRHTLERFHVGKVGYGPRTLELRQLPVWPHHVRGPAV